MEFDYASRNDRSHAKNARVIGPPLEHEDYTVKQEEDGDDKKLSDPTLIEGGHRQVLSPSTNESSFPEVDFTEI